jgi:FkbH-like protein
VTAEAVGTEAGAGLRAMVKAAVAEGQYDQAWQRLRPSLLGGDELSAWDLARTLVRQGASHGWSPSVRRRIRLGVRAAYEATELCEHIRLACFALGIEAVLYQGAYGQLEQEVLPDESGLARFEPTHVLLAPTAVDLAFPPLAETPAMVLDEEVERCRTLWSSLARKLGARVVQHTFVAEDETPYGHLALRLAGSKLSLVRELNARLAVAAGPGVLLVDCERLAARIGKQHWFDPRLWFAARRPYAQGVASLLARETAAVIAADVGLAARCLVVDLDNTLWGGLVAEEGGEGVVVGEGPEGEAFATFQEYLRALAERGLLLAVASKNDAEIAREPFERNPRMRLRLDDFAAFVADWRRKPEQVEAIAEQLGLGLDVLVFADDNPAECAEVAAALPAVDTVRLDVPPSEFVRTLASSVRFEAAALTAEDTARRESYRGLARAEEDRASATSLEDFWRSLAMRARVRDLEPSTIERAAQLTQKTNQFNLTLRRRSVEDIEQLAHRDGVICRMLELEDRFANHGLVGLAIAVPDPRDHETALLDTLLMSCRVIGRTAEVHLLSHVGRAALEAGFTKLGGLYVPGPRNALVSDLYRTLGFVPSAGECDRWDYDLVGNGPLESIYIVDE